MSKTNWFEEPISFDCEGCRLVGIVTQPAQPNETGVVIVVGGPQYRAGSHRQFTLLARHLAENGIASIRFDYRGMGDSEGEMRNFEKVDADIRAAIDTLMQRVPDVRRVALWGLCDAASAALYYGYTDTRVSDLILLNPWVHSAAGAAKARLKHYYLTRLAQRSFWAKLLSGKFNFGTSMTDLTQSARLASGGVKTEATIPIFANPLHGSPGYIDLMLQGLQRFTGKVQIILSGNDLTAQEFQTLLGNDKSWRRTCRDPRVTVVTLPNANHTFSTRHWRGQVANWTCLWLDTFSPAGNKQARPYLHKEKHL